MKEQRRMILFKITSSYLEGTSVSVMLFHSGEGMEGSSCSINVFETPEGGEREKKKRVLIDIKFIDWLSFANSLGWNQGALGLPLRRCSD